jgi:hypothetical protein
MSLRLSADRKSSPVIRSTRAGYTVRVRNAFGLPAGTSCPGKTPTCVRVCYANSIQRNHRAVDRVMQDNFAELLACGDDVERMRELLAGLIRDFRADLARFPHATRLFRIHWNGDFFSVPYAQAWREVIIGNPDVRFWAYTRSFTPDCDVVPVLVDVANLSLYLSVDRDNAELARAVIARHPGVRIAAMAPTAADCRTLLKSVDRPAGVCPETTRKIPLVVGTGDAVGACEFCRLCVHGKADVGFSVLRR